MPQVAVVISGKAYRMACGEGEEEHLKALAAVIDGKITELRGSFGEIGDMRLHVMSALMVADEQVEAKRRIAALEEELAALRTIAAAGDERAHALEAQVADTIGRAAERIERLAKVLNPTAPA